MISILPFDKNKFSDEFKPRLSGLNTTLKYENTESDLTKVAVDMVNVLGQKTYDQIIVYYKMPNPDKTGSADAVDALQRAMLHFTLYHGLIFFTVRIGNDGVTIKKNDDETTAYKYQTDELKENLIKTAWFWMGVLYGILGANKETFPDWEDSDQRKALTDLPVGVADFQYWYGVSDEYFIIKAAALIRKVYNDEILPRMKEGINNPVKDESGNIAKLRADVDKNMRRAIVYKVMALACKTFAYFELPEPIRLDTDNEMGKNHKESADNYIKNVLAKSIDADAAKYFVNLESSVALFNRALNPPSVDTNVIKSIHQRGSDKFVFPG